MPLDRTPPVTHDKDQNKIPDSENAAEPEIDSLLEQLQITNPFLQDIEEEINAVKETGGLVDQSLENKKPKESQLKESEKPHPWLFPNPCSNDNQENQLKNLPLELNLPDNWLLSNCDKRENRLKRQRNSTPYCRIPKPRPPNQSTIQNISNIASAITREESDNLINQPLIDRSLTPGGFLVYIDTPERRLPEPTPNVYPPTRQTSDSYLSLGAKPKVTDSNPKSNLKPKTTDSNLNSNPKPNPDPRLNSNMMNNNTGNVTDISMIMPFRGVSVKDAIEMIPRFNGSNISLNLFIEGLEESRQLLPPNLEGALVKLLRVRLFGEALSCSQGEDFKTINEVKQFFTEIYGSAKTYHEIEGELAKVKQKGSESVITYLTRVREIEKEIIEAAKREPKITIDDEFKKDLEETVVRYFVRGLKWEIRVRMEKPNTIREAREQALEIERELPDFTIEFRKSEAQAEPKAEQKPVVKSVKHVQENVLTCQFCRKNGHELNSCYKFNDMMQSNGAQAPRNYQGNSNTWQPRSKPWNDSRQPNRSWNSATEPGRNWQTRPQWKGPTNTEPWNRSNNASGSNFASGTQQTQYPRRNDANPANVDEGRERCGYCDYRGHHISECRRRMREDALRNQQQGNENRVPRSGATREPSQDQRRRSILRIDGQALESTSAEQ